ncbi:RND transporter [Photobacterium jeanii]|uniref:Efflux pump membrane transporter n=1 Tax=Photobacterium jeanii TaxID=858640 RepID=A0A178K2D9_9GAMM|nr:multidrug efflux RND transporter permease subunit [Photobacterium jeanii]OAN10903.1 RND transporter [Photobacterium jeanii]PST90418.1 hydrophobe/amphiphile efflux-1 family RND transporter [Photobacterium jeanii]
MAEFFIKRPKFAIVISIVMTLAGLLSLAKMPISQFPNVVPPSIEVFAVFPGADHNTLRDTVATTIEQEINGVEGMIYLDSKSNNDNTYIAYVTFAIGTDPDKAQVLVQNRVNKAMAKLPEPVKQQGVTVEKVSNSILMTVNPFSPNGTYDNLFLSNYASLNMVDALLRVKGVGKVQVIGEQKYSMRVWLNPEKMAAKGITANDISAAIAAQNTTVAAGKLGERPGAGQQVFQYTIQTQGRLVNAEQFEEVILRAEPDGSFIYLKDVARVELGSEQYAAMSTFAGKESPILAIYQAPGANAVQVAEDVRAAMESLADRFPTDMDYEVSFDSTTFIKLSMDEVFETLYIAVCLVVVVTFLFLQSWRATLIPTVAIPVSLVATFVVMSALGIDINTISMFGLILAIGVVVDAAIVVLENVERIMEEEHLAAPEATSKAMKEVTGPLIASALVLLAVFGPVSVAPGMVGQMYQQFGVTISVSTAISTIVALTLTPALCAALMRHEEKPTRGVLAAFNRFVDWVTRGYVNSVGFLGKRLLIAGFLFAAMIGATAMLGKTMSTDFIPADDQGSFMVDVSLPEAASMDRTDPMIDDMVAKVSELPGVKHVVAAKGYSLLKGAASSNAGMMIVVLDDWHERNSPEETEFALVAKVQAMIDGDPNVAGMAFSMPPIPGLGNAGGLTLQVEELNGRPIEEMAPALESYLAALNEAEEIDFAFTTFSANVPQLYLDIDRAKAMALGVDLAEVNATLGAMMGNAYVNDFTKFGKNYQVNLLAEQEYRNEEADLSRVYVRSASGEMIKLSSFAEYRPLVGADSTARYNLYNTAQVLAIPAAGFSSGDAIAKMEALAKTALPDGYAVEWTGMTYQELEAGDSAPYLFALALLFTYLFLVAQYESWMIPLAIVLCVPTGVFGALAFVASLGGTINLYTQVALILMIGMASRNAILIVEFAKVLREERGLGILESAKEAIALRIRAVMMTAFAFILGVVPLVLASNAGAASLNALGAASFGGMLAATIIGCLLVPIYFVALQRLREWRRPLATKQVEQQSESQLEQLEQAPQQA